MREPQDAHWMRRALHLARRHAGHTWPNPSVGAVIVRDGILLAEAAHLAAGAPHAEAAALAELRRQGIDPAGATLYVSLEPCHHQGRTPPCSQSIAESGIARLVYAVADLNPRLPGGGARWLRNQGLRVDEGPYRREAYELNHPFFESGGGSEVHITLKLALSVDGHLARRPGRVEDPRERAITGAGACRRVHRMRAGCSAVLVGAGTVRADRPRLDVRLIPPEETLAPPPRPVILDSGLRLPVRWLPPASLVLCTTESESRAAPFLDAGHEVAGCAESLPGRLDWKAVLKQLAERGLGILLVEGGASVASTLLEAGFAHRVHLFVAPLLLGGDGPGLFSYPGPPRRYLLHRLRRVGEDIECVLRRRGLPMVPG